MKRNAHGDQGEGILDRAFRFGDQDTIESVITFRIDNRLSRGVSSVSFAVLSASSCDFA
jgi:hypothetical protein